MCFFVMSCGEALQYASVGPAALPQSWCLEVVADHEV
jgi:hypothetical protein